MLRFKSQSGLPVMLVKTVGLGAVSQTPLVSAKVSCN
jgi:hypothetical protein